MTALLFLLLKGFLVLPSYNNNFPMVIYYMAECLCRRSVFYTEILLPDLLSNIHACQWVTVNMCARKAEPSWSIICDLLTIIEVTILNP